MIFRRFEISPPAHASKLTDRQQVALDAYRHAHDAMRESGDSLDTGVFLSDYRHRVPEGFDAIFGNEFTLEERGDVLRAGEMAALTPEANEFLNESMLLISRSHVGSAWEGQVTGEYPSLQVGDRLAIFSVAQIFAEIS